MNYCIILLYQAFLELNFVLYVKSSEFVRAAYWTFLKDVFYQQEEEFESRVWWSGMLHQSMSGISDIIKSLAMSEAREDIRQTSSITSDIGFWIYKL